MSSSRDPVAVINAILAKVPAGFGSVARRLENVREASAYRPPDGQWPTWRDISDVLNSELPFPPVDDWQKDVFRIVTGKEPPAAEGGKER